MPTPEDVGPFSRARFSASVHEGGGILVSSVPSDEAITSRAMLAFSLIPATAQDALQEAGYAALRLMQALPHDKWTVVMDALLDWMDEKGALR